MQNSYVDDGHRIRLKDSVIDHAKQVFEAGLQLEAILIAHEYLEQRLNTLYRSYASPKAATVHRQFKQQIELLRAQNKVSAEEYQILNEFNRLRNVNSNQILDLSLKLAGAKKGELLKAMALAENCEDIISGLATQKDKQLSRRKKETRKS